MVKSFQHIWHFAVHPSFVVCGGYKLVDIWNMGELGLFFKFLPDKDLIEMAKS